MDQDLSVEIPRTGQHPYMPGAVRFSIWILIALWIAAGAFFIIKMVDPNPRSIGMGLISVGLGVGTIYGFGIWMAKDNPFHQEKLFASIIRTLRGRTNLET